MSFLGGLIGGITGFLTGGPLGAVAGVVGGASAGSAGGAVQAGVAGVAPYRSVPQAGGINSAALPGAFGAPLLGTPFPRLPAMPTGFAATGGMTGTTMVAEAGATAAAPTGSLIPCDTKGHHLNKSRYYTKGKYAVFGTEIVPHEKGTVCVKNRRMNVGNARALRHALRRARGFEKLAMRTIRILHPGKPKRFGGFKTRRRSR